MAATEENKQSFKIMLFASTGADGKPMEFNMNPCPQKQALQPLIEVGNYDPVAF